MDKLFPGVTYGSAKIPGMKGDSFNSFYLLLKAEKS